MNRLFVSLCATTIISTHAYAQNQNAPTPAREGRADVQNDTTSATGATDTDTGDIVVTALKQGQTALQASATITVLEPEALAAKNIVAGNQLNAVVPGLTMSVGVGGLPGTSFRGLGSNSAVFSLEPSVAEYIDGAYMPHARDYVSPLYDLDHIEFIKGTQSTLLGKNTSLGAISIVNRRPGKTASYDAQLTRSFGVGGTRLQAAVNTPITDTLQVRAAVLASQEEGWVNNVYRGFNEPDQTNLSGRLSLAWQPTSTIDVFASYQHDYRKFRGQSLEVVSDPNGVIAARARAAGVPFDTQAIGVSATGSGPFGTAPGTDPFDRQNTDRLNAIVDIRLGDHTLTSQTAYTTWKSPRLTDLDFTAANLFNLADDERSKTFTQELRLASPTDNRLTYLVGLFYYYNRWSYGRTFGGAPSNSVGFPLIGIAASQTELPTRAYSGFASATLEIVDGLKLDGGLRYTHEKKEGTFGRVTTGTLVGNFPTTPRTTYAPQVTQPLDFNAGLRYEPTNRILLYGSYSKGSKSGGFQDAPTTIAGAPFQPETAYSAEIGGKFRFTGGYLTIAGFHTRVEGFQTSYTTPVGNPPIVQTVVGNSNVRSQGVEANLSYEMVRGLTVGGSVVYADSVFTGPFPANASVAREGDRLTRAPLWSGNATIDYVGDISDGLQLFAGARTDFASKRLYQFVVPQPLAPVGEAYATVDARIGVRASDRQWELAVVGNNIGDRRVVDFATAITLGGGAYYGSFNRPRVIALQLTVKR
jgi:outer membrane receptor protein involved in Fe transport